MDFDTITFIQTTNFSNDLKKLSQQQRNSLLFDLNRKTRGDIERIPNYKGEHLSRFKKYTFHDYRVILIYCNQCYNEYNHIFNCKICDSDNLIRFIGIGIFHRKKLYRHYKNNFSNLRLIFRD